MGDRTLNSSRLIFKIMTPDDLEAFYDIVKLDDVGRWLASGRGKTKDEALAKILSYRESFDKSDYGVWGVWEKSSDRLIGQAGLLLTDDREVELLYALAPEFWHAGYGSECAVRVRDYAFEVLNLTRVVAYARPDNERSVRVLEKCGMRPAGIKDYHNVRMRYYIIDREKWINEKVSDQY